MTSMLSMSPTNFLKTWFKFNVIFAVGGSGAEDAGRHYRRKSFPKRSQSKKLLFDFFPQLQECLLKRCWLIDVIALHISPSGHQWWRDRGGVAACCRWWERSLQAWQSEIQFKIATTFLNNEGKKTKRFKNNKRSLLNAPQMHKMFTPPH